MNHPSTPLISSKKYSISIFRTGTVDRSSSKNRIRLVQPDLAKLASSQQYVYDHSSLCIFQVMILCF